MNKVNAAEVDTAQEASEEALAAVFSALEDRRNFKLEAGAGAGKTYSLIQALKHILKQRGTYLPRNDQRIACLTYTKVARDEIISRTDDNPSVFADTLHGFLWEMIRPYQKALLSALRDSAAWEDLIAENNGVEGSSVDYDLGFRGVHEDKVTLHHDDVPMLAIRLFNNSKFRALVADRFPIIFIDEYQDTPAGLAEAMLSGHGVDHSSPVLGFFGDHWQQIYDRTCGSIEHETVAAIPKNANFRSDRSIVDFLNHLRPELPQSPAEGARTGSVTIYHTNEWPGKRQTHSWKGQISQDATSACISWLRSEEGGNQEVKGSKDLKFLMLTHATIANELGYATLPKVFRYNDAFIRKEDPVIEYLLDTVEPALEAFSARRYGELFAILGGRRPMLRSTSDKELWSTFFKVLGDTGQRGTVGDVLDHLRKQSLFAVPTRVEKKERELREGLAALSPGSELVEPRRLVEHQNLRAVNYSEIRALRTYLMDNTVYSTKHAVKGAEFDDVVVLVGRGWSQYDFASMLSKYPTRNSLLDKERASFERSRNLFYVAASRAKNNLVFLFVQELQEDALTTLRGWIGAENVVSIKFADELTPLTI